MRLSIRQSRTLFLSIIIGFCFCWLLLVAYYATTFSQMSSMGGNHAAQDAVYELYLATQQNSASRDDAEYSSRNWNAPFHSPILGLPKGYDSYSRDSMGGVGHKSSVALNAFATHSALIDSLTLFTTFTPPTVPMHALSHTHNYTLHALHSWRLAMPRAQILVYVQAAKHCVEFISPYTDQVDCLVLSDACWPAARGTSQDWVPSPRLTCLLDEASLHVKQTTRHSMMMYAELSLLFFDDCLAALRTSHASLDSFVLIGQSRVLHLSNDHEVLYQPYLESAVSVRDDQGKLLATPDYIRTLRRMLGEWHAEIQEANFDSFTEEEASHTDIHHSHTLRYFAYLRRNFDVSSFVQPDTLLHAPHWRLNLTHATKWMRKPGLVHGWERALIQPLLNTDTIRVIDATSAITSIDMQPAYQASLNNILSDKAAVLAGMRQDDQIAALHHEEQEELEQYGSQSGIRPNNTFDIHSGLSAVAKAGAHYELVGKCPSCRLKQQHDPDLLTLLNRRSDAHRHIIVVLVTADYVELAFSWICRANLIGIRNYILLAQDRISYGALLRRGVPVALTRLAPYRKRVHEAGSKEFEEGLYAQALFLNQVAMLGFSLILTHLDTIWFSNALDLLVIPEYVNTSDSSVAAMQMRNDLLSASKQQSSRISASDHPLAQCDMMLEMYGERSSGAILVVRATEQGKKFTKDYLICERDNLQFISLHGRGRFTFSDDAATDCLEFTSSLSVIRGRLNRCILDKMLFPTEREFFGLQWPQRHGIWPLVVHMDTSLGIENKTRLMQMWNLWKAQPLQRNVRSESSHALSNGGGSSTSQQQQLNQSPINGDGLQQVLDPYVNANRTQQQRLLPNELRVQCIDSQPHYAKTGLAIAPSFTEIARMQLNIHLLTTDDIQALQHTLDSLKAAHYANQKHIVNLFLYVSPSSVVSVTGTSALEGESYLRCLELANSFEWQLGDKEVVALQQYTQVAWEWISQWKSTMRVVQQRASKSQSSSETLNADAVDDALVLPLVAGQTVSLDYFTLLTQIVQWYYHDATQYDAQMIGFSLRHENAIVGETPQERLGSKTPITELDGATVYLQQYAQLTGTVFFPRHWARFVQWFNSRVTDYLPEMESPQAFARTACVSTLYTNKLFLADPKAHWYQWLLRFNFEEGHYVLYTHLYERRQEFLASPRGSSQDAAMTYLQGSYRLQQQKQQYKDGKQQHHQSAAQFDPALLGRPVAMLIDTSQTASQLQTLLSSYSSSFGQLPPRSALTLYDFHFRPYTQALHLLRLRASMFAPDFDSYVDLIRNQEQSEWSERAPVTRRQVSSIHDRYRCYVIGDEVGDNEAVTDAATQSISKLIKPSPPDLLPMELQYRNICTTQMSVLQGSQPETMRLLIYDAQANGGASLPFDRHLRAIYSTFVLSLVTRRLFVTNAQNLVQWFENPLTDIVLKDKKNKLTKPQSCIWSLEALRAKLQTKGVSLNDDMSHGYLFKNISDKLRTEKLDTLLAPNVITHFDAVSHDKLLFMNPLYLQWARTLFGSQSRMRRTGAAMHFLLSRVKSQLLYQVRLIKRRLHVHAEQHTIGTVDSQEMSRQVTLASPNSRTHRSVSVHINPTLAALPKLKPGKQYNAKQLSQLVGMPEYWNCLRSLLTTAALPVQSTTIFLMSDRQSSHELHSFLYEYTKQQLGEFGRIVTFVNATSMQDGFPHDAEHGHEHGDKEQHSFEDEHDDASAHAHSEDESLDSNDLSAENIRILDDHLNLGKAQLNEKDMAPEELLNGFLFADSSMSISAGSTYGIFYAARTNFAQPAFIAKYPLPNKKDQSAQADRYCGPMLRVDLPPKADLVF